MIKYSNVTKDIIKDILKKDKNSDAYLNFEGVWKPIGTSRNQPITIKRSGDNFIVQTPIYDAGDGHDISCKIDGFGAMNLKSEYVKKA